MRFDPVSWIVGLTGCVADWMVTRQWRKIFLNFLPLVFAGLVGFLVACGTWLNHDLMAERYLQLADAEVAEWENQWAPKTRRAEDEEGQDAEDPAAQPNATETEAKDSPANPSQAPKQIPPYAEMLFRRVKQLQDHDDRSVFFVAMCYIQRGAVQQGLTMLSRIAPDDRIGYLPAHAWLAQQMLSRPIAPEELRRVRHHTEAALRWDRTSPQLLAVISELYFKINDVDAAVRAMKQAAERDSNYMLPLSKLAAVDKKHKILAEEALDKSVKHFLFKLDRDPRDIQARLMVADSYLQKSDFQAAENTIVEGMKLVDDPVLKSALSEVYRSVFVATSSLTNNSWTGDIELLDRAYRLDPNNLRIFEEIAKLARITGVSPHDELMAQLRKNLAEGRSTSVTHTWIAERYLVSNELAKAIPHLEQAVERDPMASRCWNNLAYCVAFTEPQRLEEALKYADQAVKIAPRVPDFHDTRGTVLMKLGKTREAITSFERAIEETARSGGRFAPQPGFHERLSEAYLALGDVAMADTHRKVAGEISSRLQAAANQLSADQTEAAPSQPTAQADSGHAQPASDSATGPTVEAGDSSEPAPTAVGSPTSTADDTPVAEDANNSGNP